MNPRRYSAEQTVLAFAYAARGLAAAVAIVATAILRGPARHTQHCGEGR